MPFFKSRQTDQTKKGKDKVKFSEKKRIRTYNPIFERTSLNSWNVVGLPILGTLVLAIALALIIVGAVKDINDLIILGSLFLVGSAVFFFIMCNTVCRPLCQRNIVETYELSERQTSDQPLTDDMPTKSSSVGYYNMSYNTNEDLNSPRDRQQPTEDQLYGNKMRSFLATPATTSGLVMYEDESGTPPPPRLAMPSDPDDKHAGAVFTMDVEGEMKRFDRKISNMSSVELL